MKCGISTNGIVWPAKTTSCSSSQVSSLCCRPAHESPSLESSTRYWSLRLLTWSIRGCRPPTGALLSWGRRLSPLIRVGLGVRLAFPLGRFGFAARARGRVGRAVDVAVVVAGGVLGTRGPAGVGERVAHPVADLALAAGAGQALDRRQVQRLARAVDEVLGARPAERDVALVAGVRERARRHRAIELARKRVVGEPVDGSQVCGEVPLERVGGGAHASEAARARERGNRYARGGIRTRTPRRAMDFESIMSASFITRAGSACIVGPGDRLAAANARCAWAGCSTR